MAIKHNYISIISSCSKHSFKEKVLLEEITEPWLRVRCFRIVKNSVLVNQKDNIK